MKDKTKCSISIVMNSIGAGASSSSKPEEWPVRPTAPSSPPTAKPPCSRPWSRPSSRSAGIDFLPLTVNYQEKFYAAGRIPGGYFKREGRPTEKETLISRLIDRPIRPLFADGWRYETQVIVTMLSHDLENDPDIVAHGRGVRRADAVGRAVHGPDRRRARRLHQRRIRAQPADRRDGRDRSSTSSSPAPQDAVLMVESEAKELSEDIMLGAVMFGHRHFQPVIEAIIHLAEKAAKEPREFAVPDNSAIEKEMLGLVEKDLRAAYAIPRKAERHDAVAAVKEKVMAHFFPDGKDNPERPMSARRRRVQGARRQDRALEHPRHRQAHRRPRSRDRASDHCRGRRAAAHPRLGAVHPRRDAGARRRHARHRRGRAVHRRACRAPTRKRFLLHYNFPPFSVGETGRIGGPGRREIGHGKLAWRAIRPMLPAKEDFPYTIRVVSEITEFERLVLDGDGVRRLARADGCRRAAEAADRGHRHGPDPGRQALRRALRHPRRRGSSRRHGLQGGRHRRRHHLAADGHQDRRHHRRDHEGRARPGQGRPPAHPRRDGQGAHHAPAPSSANMRRASRSSRSRPTRSAK